jgi:hypothetical protein
MAKIEFPRQLDKLLAGSELLAPVRAFADKAGEILADNKLPFFPDYTDHGIVHVNRVLKAEVELVPKGVWEKSKEDSDPQLLCDVDAAIIIGATILHDIAMHLHPEGFKELIHKESRFKPLKWFDQNKTSYTADIPWFELWENYTREARRFSERQLSSIIGEKSASAWKFDKLPEDPGMWELNHKLIIGEFIRRHHARLAHEIAMYGFPGIPSGAGDGQFPAIGEDIQNGFKRIADLIGLTARSHGISLRVCNEYLERRHPKQPKPAGSAVLYPMALLRIADYFQIDQSRAPAVLLQLRDPQSPISVQEWQKHKAIENIGPANDPRGRMITVSNDISLPLYLQLNELLESLQAEIDQSTAVLDEMYGNRNDLGLDQLNLAVRRIHSNLQTPAFIENLKYVPVKSGFSTDPNLLSLLVEPLYGNHPGVGVRELMQNAVDAVCELDAWCKKHNKSVESLDLPDLGCDVLIEFEKMDDDRWILRVKDRGIGMTSDTIQNYFLRAGASFRHSAEWMQEFLDDDGKPRVARAGRFGIGAFAVFLLGSSFKLWTRHVSEETGFSIEITAASQLITIQKAPNLQVGTTIEVELSVGTVNYFRLESECPNFSSLVKKEEQRFWHLNGVIDWYCWDWPKISKTVKNGNSKILLYQLDHCPIRKCELPPEWALIRPTGFDEVYWTFGGVPALSCNGFNICEPHSLSIHWTSDKFDETKFAHPCIAVKDSIGVLPLTIQRYGLLYEKLLFFDELERDVTMSFIAYTLICGPITQMEGLSNFDNFPLIDPIYLYGSKSLNGDICPLNDGCPIRWYVTSEGLVPRDAWLYTLLPQQSCLLYGIFNPYGLRFTNPHFKFELRLLFAKKTLQQLSGLTNVAILSLFGAAKDVWDSHMTESLFTNIAMGENIDSDIVMASHCMVSTYNGNEIVSQKNTKNEKLLRWTSLPCDNENRACFETSFNSFKSKNPLFQIIMALENCLISCEPDIPEVKKMTDETALFVAELKIKRVNAPESLLAKVWNECLGPSYIPFDPFARAELIENGRKHPELKRHIEAWEEMKRTGSKWATGEWR